MRRLGKSFARECRRGPIVFVTMASMPRGSERARYNDEVSQVTTIQTEFLEHRQERPSKSSGEQNDSSVFLFVRITVLSICVRSCVDEGSIGVGTVNAQSELADIAQDRFAAKENQRECSVLRTAAAGSRVDVRGVAV